MKSKLFVVLILIMFVSIKTYSLEYSKIPNPTDTIMPVFPGGEEALQAYIAQNVVYPRKK